MTDLHYSRGEEWANILAAGHVARSVKLHRPLRSIDIKLKIFNSSLPLLY
jgi:hypothetical protein